MKRLSFSLLLMAFGLAAMFAFSLSASAYHTSGTYYSDPYYNPIAEYNPRVVDYYNYKANTDVNVSGYNYNPYYTNQYHSNQYYSNYNNYNRYTCPTKNVGPAPTGCHYTYVKNTNGCTVAKQVCGYNHKTKKKTVKYNTQYTNTYTNQYQHNTYNTTPSYGYSYDTPEVKVIGNSRYGNTFTVSIDTGHRNGNVITHRVPSSVEIISLPSNCYKDAGNDYTILTCNGVRQVSYSARIYHINQSSVDLKTTVKYTDRYGKSKTWTDYTPVHAY